MQSPKKSGGIAKYILTLLVAAIASVQVAAFGMADLRVYQDMKSDIAEIERRMPRQQDSAGVEPGSVQYAGLGRIVINGEVVQERTPGAPRPAVQPAPGPVQAPEASQPPPQQPPSDTQEPKEDVPQKEEPAKTQSTNQAASSTPTPPKSSGSSGSSGSGQSGSSISGNQSSAVKDETTGNGQTGGSFSSGNVLITTASDNNDDPVYHTMNCRSAKKISEEDKAWLTESDAKAEDRRLCKWCAKGG